ncbi:hypothetical protein CDD83_4797 [Cordyceps sp. RAO-2017]|nr:hypothetical protein CDD83_4797 [Cordyceps sp. RAO-2017]
MLIMPEKSSARPPRMTSRVLPSDDRPAVSANGTVSPSEKPMMTSRSVSPRSALDDDEPAEDASDDEQALRSWGSALTAPACGRSVAGSAGRRGDLSDDRAIGGLCCADVTDEREAGAR